MTIIGRVYLITNLVNGKKYVGCTEKDIQTRWRMHLKDARRITTASALHKAIRKYGHRSFSIIELEVVSGSRQTLFEAETRFIELHGSVAPIGYNLTLGGDGVDFSVPEVYARYRENHIKATSTPEYRERYLEGRKRMVESPSWQVAKDRLSELFHERDTAAYRLKLSAIGKERLSNPEVRSAHEARNQSLPDDPSWREAHLAGVRKRSKDPKWIAANLERLAKARLAKAAKKRATLEVA